MRYWVQYLAYSKCDPSRLIDALGSDAVFILDGRKSMEAMRDDAFHQARRLERTGRHPAFQLVKGPRLFVENKRGPIVMIEVKGKP